MKAARPAQDGHETGALDVSEKLAWLRLARTENVGPVTFHRLLESYGSASRVLSALPELARRGGRKKPLVVPPLSAVENEYERLTKMGGILVAACEPAYPLALSAIDDAPPVISVKGRMDLLQKPSIGIVGARNASMNGRSFAKRLAHDLGGAGQIVTSGLARGIDTAAHEGALETGTIAVVAGGLDVVYPPENQKLYEALCEKGLVVAESPLSQEPFAQSFPRRNRIISGLSQGVVIVEATMRSGSLITARLAGEQGRDVYAVPGHPLDPRAEGPNNLIRDGATLIRNATDVLDEMRSFTGSWCRKAHEPGPSDSPASLPGLEDGAGTDEGAFESARQSVLDHLGFAPCFIDDLVRQSGLGAAALQIALLELELAGFVQRLPGNRAVRVQSP